MDMIYKGGLVGTLMPGTRVECFMLFQQVRGDGLVPVNSALLRDARQLIQADTAHGGFFGSTWYASPARLEAWWRFALD